MTADTGRISAFAKVNLALHVTGRRADGYHDLDSLVVFPGLCDDIILRPAERLDLVVDGPCARGVPADAGNLVLKAATALADRLGMAQPGAHIHLTKHIPPAAGLGGGSADAAAVLRGLNDLWRGGLDDQALAELGLPLGADVPVCLFGRPARMQGIGGQISPVALDLKGTPALVLVNPGVAISTKAVFSSFGSSFGEPLNTFPEGGWADIASLVDYLRTARNDLEDGAREYASVIGKVLDLLRGWPHCQLARMTGSGATCFGIFPEERWARQALLDLKERQPDWWVCQTPLGPSWP